MKKIATFPKAKTTSRPPSASTESIGETIKFLLLNLDPTEREKILDELTQAFRPISVERGGEILGTIVRFLQPKQEVTVEDLRTAVKDAGLEARPKEVYNAIGYLTRKGHMRRVGYGRYVVDGVEIVTSEDIGGAPSRNEDGYRIDDSNQ
ncbi:hypothetical protein U8P76_23720 [Rhizobium johnstonii]|nr:hypothetical protein U8P76_23720 [Rhizobium johnstonii]